MLSLYQKNMMLLSHSARGYMKQDGTIVPPGAGRKEVDSMDHYVKGVIHHELTLTGSNIPIIMQIPINRCIRRRQ